MPITTLLIDHVRPGKSVPGRKFSRKEDRRLKGKKVKPWKRSMQIYWNSEEGTAHLSVAFHGKKVRSRKESREINRQKIEYASAQAMKRILEEQACK
jgi:hypothetical protein